jgi:hypothetical protein
MFLRSLFLAIAIAVYCPVRSSAQHSTAQEARVFGESDKIAIEKMYDRYFQAFIKKDYAALRECVQAPFVVLTGGQMQSLESVDAIITFYRKQLESLERRNYDHSDIVNTRITPLTPDSALINKAYRRYKKDASLLEEGAAVYPVSKATGAWKLRGLIGQEPQYFGKVY